MDPNEFVAFVDDRDSRSAVPAETAVAAFLDRIDAWQPVVNAFITVTPELARSDARRVDRAREEQQKAGALDGLVLAIKDDVDVGGVRCTVGSRFYAKRVPEVDAEVVRRLRAAGGVIIGKVGLHEWAYGATSNNPHYGAVRNPWDPSRIPGGSSGGSASAVAADLCIAAIGSDAGGSVRVPAAFNGVSGLRPTLGAISSIGTHPICWSFEVLGPMARSVRDVAAVYEIIAGYDSRDPHSAEDVPDSLSTLEGGVQGLRIGIPTGFFFDDLDAQVHAAVRQAADDLSSLDADLVDVVLPGAEDAYHAARTIVLAEALAIQEQRLAEHPELFGEDVRRRLELGKAVSGVDFARSVETVRAWRATVLEAFRSVDVILTPTTSTAAPEIEGAEMIETTARVTRLTWPWSAAGVPGISIPCGLADEGPIGLQLAAGPWKESTILQAGIAYQEATPWHRLRPPNAAAPTAADSIASQRR